MPKGLNFLSWKADGDIPAIDLRLNLRPDGSGDRGDLTTTAVIRRGWSLEKTIHIKKLGQKNNHTIHFQ